MTKKGSDTGSMSMDEKKQRRLMANRRSAHRSRLKKQKLMEDLKQKIRNKDIYIRTLEAHIMGLNDEIRTRDFLLETLKEVTGVAVDDPSMLPSEIDLHQMLKF